MSALVYDNEVRQLAEIDRTNPLSQYVKVAFLPNQGSGQNITEVVTGVSYAHPQPITWNADGSVTAQRNNNSDYVTLTSTGGTIQLLNDDVIVFVDIDIVSGHPDGTPQPVIISLVDSNSQIQVKLDNFGVNKLYCLYSLQFNSIVQRPEFTTRKVLCMRWDSSTQEMKTYINGVLQFTNSISSSSTSTMSLNKLRLGIGGTTTKLYSSAVLSKVGAFTASELDEILKNPYQVFRTQQDAQQQYGLKLETGSHSISIPFTGSFSGTITYSDDTTAVISGTGTYNLDGTTPVFIKKITATHNTSVYEVFDFNKIDGTTVTSETTTLVCTLSGLPADSGYVRDANGVISGYKIGGSVTVTLAMTGAYSGTITYDDDTTAVISGSGNKVLDNTESKPIKKVIATDTVKSFDWDFTTGDTARITETINANHATITNARTSGFLPIIPVDVYMVGSGTVDYADITSFASAQSSSTTNDKECRLVANSIGGSVSGFAKGLILNGVDKSKTITSALTLTTTGLTQINNVKAGDIDATGATKVVVDNSEAADATG
jgi:hypothetical protein